MSKPWGHLIEAGRSDERLRKLERAYHATGTLEALDELLRIAQDLQRWDILRQYRPQRERMLLLDTLPSNLTPAQIRQMEQDNTPNRVNMVLRAGHNTVLYHRTYRNADNTPQRWRVSGKTKTWKTRPTHFKTPVKHGMYNHDYITHDNADEFSFDEGEAMGRPQQNF